MKSPISIENLQTSILEIRGNKVLLDSDVAKIYGVETKRINEVARNNLEKFPEGYILELSSEEWSALKSKFSTSTKGGKVKPPTAFPEKGLYMLATILKSKQATQATFTIIEAFAKIRELSSAIRTLSATPDEVQQKHLTRKRIFRHEDGMEKIYRKGFGFCLISHKSFQTHRIINRSSSVSSVRSVVNSAGFGLNAAKRGNCRGIV